LLSNTYCCGCCYYNTSASVKWSKTKLKNGAPGLDGDAGEEYVLNEVQLNIIKMQLILFYIYLLCSGQHGSNATE